MVTPFICSVFLGVAHTRGELFWLLVQKADCFCLPAISPNSVHSCS